MVPVSVEEIISLRWEHRENHQKCEELSLGEFTFEIHIRHPRGSCWRGVRRYWSQERGHRACQTQVILQTMGLVADSGA